MSRFVKIVNCDEPFWWHSNHIGSYASVLEESDDEYYLSVETVIGIFKGWADKKDAVECDEHGNLVVTTNEENKMEWRNIKVRVSSPEMSRAFQEEAFKNGCQWIDGSPVDSELEANYLFIDGYGNISFVYDNHTLFQDNAGKEVIVDTTYKFSLKEETFEFDGKTYNKAKFLNAIKGLEQ